MSYIVDVTYSPRWYVNAWVDAFHKKASHRGYDDPDGYWNRAYPDYVFNWGGIDGPNTVTFPDEQSFVWFKLKWS